MGFEHDINLALCHSLLKCALALIIGLLLFITGVFTAPVNGVYYFNFIAFGFGNSNLMGPALYKNRDLVVSVLEHQSAGDNHEYGSSSAVLQLETKDTVYIHLPKGRKVYDDVKGCTTFAGYVLWAT